MVSAISLVTLLTDFGERDYFVPSMKGVMLGINPQLRIVDMSHQVPPHEVEQASFLLGSCYQFFPDGTIHVVVVDPGVGSARRALFVSTARHFFLAPDNGVLSHVLREEPGVEVRAIENKQYRLDSAGATFDGRDLFSPCAAWLSKGKPPGSFGRLIYDQVMLPDESPKMKQNVLVGRLVYIDQFGNGISNITKADIDTFRTVTKQNLSQIRFGDYAVQAIKTHYGEGARGVPDVLFNSNGYLEVFMKQDRAADRCGLQVGQPIEVL